MVLQKGYTSFHLFLTLLIIFMFLMLFILVFFFLLICCNLCYYSFFLFLIIQFQFCRLFKSVGLLIKLHQANQHWPHFKVHECYKLEVTGFECLRKSQVEISYHFDISWSWHTLILFIILNLVEVINSYGHHGLQMVV